MRARARWLVAGACAAWPGLGEVGSAHANPALRVEASTLVATGAELGWRSLYVRIENRGPTAVSGELEILPPRSTGARDGLRSRVPFSVGLGAKSSVEIPTRSEHRELELVVTGSDGRELTRTPVVDSAREEVAILELASPSRLASALRGMTVFSNRLARYRTTAASLAATSPPLNPATGDLVLPVYPAGYSGLALVVAPGRALSRLGAPEQSALTNWVLAGGCLAIVPQRPEDLRLPLLTALAGGAPKASAASELLAAPSVFFLPPEDPNSASGPRRLELAPGRSVEASLSGYSGGNLRETPWGAAASYGLGEVHLLAFDPEAPAALADAWVRQKLVDLARHGFDRHAQVALRPTVSRWSSAPIDGVRKNLDPNQASRWTIAVSALALLAYAALAGPLSFYLAQRRGRPLLALARLPLWSAATFTFIVVLGIFGKGLSGKSRRLSLVEAGAGMSRGSAVHFRGFYAASSEELLVRPARREQLLDLAADPETVRTLVVDRDGPRLSGLRTRPWQTLLVREEGFVELGAGVSVVPESGDYVIKNRVGRALLGVVVRLPSGQAHYFPRLADGQAVKASAGRSLGALATSAYPAPSAGLVLDARSFASALDADAAGLGQAWTALEPTLPMDNEWWSNQVPVLIAAVEGGEGQMSDSGLAVDYDRLLVRVVGTGGTR